MEYNHKKKIDINITNFFIFIKKKNDKKLLNIKKLNKNVFFLITKIKLLFKKSSRNSK